MKQFFQKIAKAIRENFVWVLDFTDRVRRRDKTRLAKISSAIGYLFFFVPVIMLENNQFGQFHANQALLNLILSVVGGTVLTFIPGIGIWLALLMELFCLFNMVRGIVLSLQGKARGIPAFGQITIIAYRLPGQ
ncbi:MAG: hypothetical protein IJA51_06440 [Oscillospiraceae bacterium]|nr:hypothetical protein [Oscillospiraceae bacterium]